MHVSAFTPHQCSFDTYIACICIRYSVISISCTRPDTKMWD